MQSTIISVHVVWMSGGGGVYGNGQGRGRSGVNRWGTVPRLQAAPLRQDSQAVCVHALLHRQMQAQTDLQQAHKHAEPYVATHTRPMRQHRLQTRQNFISMNLPGKSSLANIGNAFACTQGCTAETSQSQYCINEGLQRS